MLIAKGPEETTSTLVAGSIGSLFDRDTVHA
jgi:hypothetical protein